MKAHIFMAKSGELIEAHKVRFVEGDDTLLSLPANAIEGAPAHSYNISVRAETHDGWVLYHPDMVGGMAIFMNNHAEKMFEYLGEQ